MELPQHEFQTNIVDYYENMRESHWNPRFLQLTFDLAGRLIAGHTACTSLMADRWPEAQLVHLSVSTATSNVSFPPFNDHKPDGLVTFQLLKFIITTSLPMENVIRSIGIDFSELHAWPALQQYFARLRSVIISTTSSNHPPPPPPELSLPNFLPNFNPLLFNYLPLISNLNMFSLAQPQQALQYQMQPTHGNFLTDLLTIINNPVPNFNLATLIRPPVFTAPGLLSGCLLQPPTISSPVSLTMSPVSIPSSLAGSYTLHRPVANCSLPLPLIEVPPKSNPVTHLQVVLFKDEAKTRFMCSKCNKQWTSMKGAITFIVIMSHQLVNLKLQHWIIRPGANVLFELFPQACGDCSEKGEPILCPPKWYPEEVDKVLRNLFVNIHRTFYKNVILWEQQFDRRRRPGHPTGRHDNTKCIACLNGMCVSAIGQRNSHGQSTEGVAVPVDTETNSCQSENSPACKRRLVPAPPSCGP